MLRAEELVRTLQSLSQLNEFEETEIRAIVDLFKNKAGISKRDFVEFIEEGDFEHHDIELKGDDSVRKEQLVKNIREIFRKATQKGFSLDKLFFHLDADGDGNLTTLELRTALKKLPHFKEVTSEEFDYLVSILDHNRKGSITLDAFKQFITSDENIRTSAEAKHSVLDEDEHRSDVGQTARELFVRHIRRISEPDGGIDGLLAYLDDDEDGLISFNAFMRLLQREEVFHSKALLEEDVSRMLEQMTNNGFVSVVSLIRFLEGTEPNDSLMAQGKKSKEGEIEDEVLVAAEYEFSHDPETHALEKKIRALGRSLAKKGANVEGMFRTFDAIDSGMIRRTEFIEVMSKMGLYILEQGRVLDEAAGAGGSEGETRRQQMHQVQKLRGSGGGYAQDAPRAARRLVMGGEGGAKEGEFKVIFNYFCFER